MDLANDPMTHCLLVKQKIAIRGVDRRCTALGVAGPVFVFLEKKHLLKLSKTLPLRHTRGNRGDQFFKELSVGGDVGLGTQGSVSPRKDIEVQCLHSAIGPNPLRKRASIERPAAAGAVQR